MAPRGVAAAHGGEEVGGGRREIETLKEACGYGLAKCGQYSSYGWGYPMRRLNLPRIVF
uniref:Uncharacterized protein n=1 Tax=Oryza sativa subsp. japonica TaxID=39947 RepID=Q6UU04_ORYSJ|nr:hypothetical protein OSJNBa0070J19.10 [Oryza sativa Japonica Group]